MMQKMFGAPSFSRRDVLKSSLAAGAAFAIPGIGSAFAQGGEGPTLLSWPGNSQPYIVEAFEKANGVKVQGKEYVGGDQMMALLSQSPPGTFDVVLASTEDMSLLKEADLIEPLDVDAFPFKDLWPVFQNVEMNTFDGKTYGIVCDFSFLGLAYNTDVFTAEEVSSYEVMWSEKAKGKLGMFDWYLPPMGCISLAAGNPSPFDIDAAAFSLLKDKMKSLKPQIAGFYSVADIFSSLSNGQATLIPGIGEWVTLGLRQSGVPVDTAIPKEKGIQISESLGIVKGTKKPDMARKLINYFMSPEGQVRMATVPDNKKLIPSMAAWKLLNDTMPKEAEILKMELGKPNVMDQFESGLIVPRQLPQQQSIEEWNEAWTEFKS